MKRDILIATLGLLCVFVDINYIGFLIALNFDSSLGLRRFSFYEKELYIFSTACRKFSFVFE